MQKSVEHISALDVFYEKDERENRCVGEVLGRYIEEKMPEISRKMNLMYWLRIGHVSTLQGGKFLKVI